MDMGFLGDWGLIDRVAESEGFTEPPVKKKTSGLQSLYVNTKSRLYNLVRPISTTLPEFTNSPLIILGRVYTLAHKERLELESSASARLEKGPIWAMGFNISKPKEKPDIPPHARKFLKDFSSKIWITYRSQFPPIEPTTYTTDMGWGCMLRTGQMLLAQAFVFHYLGRDWRVQNSKHLLLYYQILRWFADVPSAPYSIHMITQMANSRFGKKVGEWFEPTTICYTLSELVATHHPEGLKMYVAKDGMIYRKEIEDMCSFTRAASEPSLCTSSSPRDSFDGLSSASSSSYSPSLCATFPSPYISHYEKEDPLVTVAENININNKNKNNKNSNKRKKENEEGEGDLGQSAPSIPSALLTAELPLSSPSSSPLVPLRGSDEDILSTSPTPSQRELRQNSPLLKTSSFEKLFDSAEFAAHLESQEKGEKESPKKVQDWCPVILLIPARLGVDTLNPVYVHALKEFLAFPQSLGIVGGKPHSSFYFVGAQDTNFFYLDPHIINPAVNMDEEFFPTATYHTLIPQTMPITEIDPSLALGFYCKDRADFDDLLLRLTIMSESGETVVSVSDEPPEYVLKARRKSMLAKELAEDEELIFM